MNEKDTSGLVGHQLEMLEISSLFRIKSYIHNLSGLTWKRDIIRSRFSLFLASRTGRAGRGHARDNLLICESPWKQCKANPPSECQCVVGPKGRDKTPTLTGLFTGLGAARRTCPRQQLICAHAPSCTVRVPVCVAGQESNICPDITYALCNRLLTAGIIRAFPYIHLLTTVRSWVSFILTLSSMASSSRYIHLIRYFTKTFSHCCLYHHRRLNDPERFIKVNCPLTVAILIFSSSHYHF